MRIWCSRFLRKPSRGPVADMHARFVVVVGFVVRTSVDNIHEVSIIYAHVFIHAGADQRRRSCGQKINARPRISYARHTAQSAMPAQLVVTQKYSRHIRHAHRTPHDEEEHDGALGVARRVRPL